MTNRSHPKSNQVYSILATDLDGTLLPLAGNQQNQEDLQRLAQGIRNRNAMLCFVTGRHFESVCNAIQTHSLPHPDWIICDVGTTIRRKYVNTEEVTSPATYPLLEEYQEHLSSIIVDVSIEEMKRSLRNISSLRLQEDEKQGEFKLSYYVDQASLIKTAQKVEEIIAKSNAPYSLINSIDPFNGDGLIDLLPAQVSKAYALDWWTNHIAQPKEKIIFAGDSGNDLAALTAGFSAILVGNASAELTQFVKASHAQAGWADRLFHAKAEATSGVLEGCQYFGICPIM